MRLIDADPLKEKAFYHEIDCVSYVEEEDVNKAPTVDAVEVVRCKDCKYRDADDFCTGRGYPNLLVPDDGFCDKGEVIQQCLKKM